VPNAAGGYNSFGPQGVSQSIPNAAGGMSTFTPGGNVIQTLPDGSGGLNSSK
jgi:hypothetical protein